MKYETALFVDDPEKHEADIDLAMRAIHGFWKAVDREDAPDRKHPLSLCIMSALAVKEVFHLLGRRDATVMRSGLDIRLLGGAGNVMSFGSPSARKTPGLWNAHMVVRLGGLLIDPTIGQCRRPWNVLPHSAIFGLGQNSGENIKIQCGARVRVTTSHCLRTDGRDHQISYFKLPFRSDQMTKGWRSGFEFSDERYKLLARDAVRVLQTASPAAEVKLAA